MGPLHCQPNEGPEPARMLLAGRSCALHLRLTMLNLKNTTASRVVKPEVS